MKLLIATGNSHKLKEIKAIFSDSAVDLLSISDFDDLPEVEEDGDTFEANAVKKAVSLARITHYWTMADDSGLMVDALDGEPGVYSARYAGEPVDYMANNNKLLKELDGVEDRSARFVCVIALSDPDGNSRTVRGECTGRITHAPRGNEGFGYDPLFVPDGYEKTFAELTESVKNAISHRAVALNLAEKKWRDFIG